MPILEQDITSLSPPQDSRTVALTLGYNHMFELADIESLLHVQ